MTEPLKSLYAILGVSPSATRPEIERAYLAAKSSRHRDSKDLWDLERAYVTLSDPNAKRRYDAEQQDGAAISAVRESNRPREPLAAERWKPPAPGAARVPRGPLAAVLLVLLALVAWKVAWPFLAWRLFRFGPGTVLVARRDGAPYGVVMAFESQHRFPNGIVAQAYRLKLPADTEQWMSRDEVNQLAVPSR